MDGTSYKTQTGKDGVTDDDMRDLRRVVKASQKQMAKGNRLDTVSIELVTEDGWQELDVALIVEEQDEYERLHTAIAALNPEQQTLIYNVFFRGTSVSATGEIELQ
jgi:DNA-directed RNA polymerase specialized sigma24 family protein